MASLEASHWIGAPLTRLDAYEKVTGRAVFTVDHGLPHMLHGKIKRSSQAHARIRSVDAERAKRLPGVRCIITGFDIPHALHGMGLNDTPTIARDVVRYVGEPVAAVAADSPSIAEEAVDVIDVEYEAITALFDPDEARRPGQDLLLHPNLSEYKRAIPPLPKEDLPNVASTMRIRHGDLPSALAKSSLVIENQFTTQLAHAFHLEPNGSVAKLESDGGLTVWTSTQSPYRIRQELSDALQMPPEQIRVIVPYVGGGFGNKLTLSAEAICSLLAIRTRKPVKILFTREEVFSATTVRHPFVIRIKDGVDHDGRLRARWLNVQLDGGAYSGGGGVRVAMTSCFATLATYDIPNLWFDSYRVYTNRVPGGAFRGFGSAQMDWAIESQMDILANELHLDPVEFRLANLAKEGQFNAIGERLRGVDNRRCLLKAAEAYRADRPLTNGPWSFGRGLAIADKYCAAPSAAVALVKLGEGRRVEVWASTAEIGVGVRTILAQIAAEELGVPYWDVKVTMADTAVTPFDAGAYSSRETYHLGNAVQRAALDVKRQVLEKASETLGRGMEELEFRSWEVLTTSEPKRSLPFESLFVHGQTKGGSFLEEEGLFLGKATFFQAAGALDPSTGRCSTDRATAFYTPAAVVADLRVNRENGRIKLLKLTVAMDVGKAINPKLVEGMMEGSAYMGASTTLFEELVLEAGKAINADLKDYKTLGSLEAPKLECFILETPHPEGPFGAKGAGEAAITCVAPAIGNAIHQATGIRFYDLPLTAEKLLLALKHR